jgi:hypothetical protein
VRLIEEVAEEHKTTLRAFLRYNQYALSFKRLARESQIPIPTGTPMVREAAIRTFLNAVFRGATVRLR